jgi:hypothetical protein
METSAASPSTEQLVRVGSDELEDVGQSELFGI